MFADVREPLGSLIIHKQPAPKQILVTLKEQSEQVTTGHNVLFCYTSCYVSTKFIYFLGHLTFLLIVNERFQESK